MGVSLRTGQFGSYYGNDFNSSNALTQAQMEVNATYIYSYLTSKGWTVNSIAAMLGNMQAESTINPGRWQGNNVGGGPAYGLVQWDPFSKYTNWATSNGFSDPSEMDSNLARIMYELDQGEGYQWITTSSYPISFEEFTTSNKSISYLTTAFLKNYERASVERLEERIEYANNWYSFLANKSNFTPMLDDSAIDNTLYWTHTSAGGYNKCIEISNGSVLPNCTGFAWGRFHMISDLADGTQDYSDIPKLSRADAGLWFGYTEDGYERGSEPKLGAVICFSDNSGGAGHVGIVEEIQTNGDVTISQSGYGSSNRFWTSTAKKTNGYNVSGYTFQGFIYNPNVIAGGSGGGASVTKRKNYNFILFNKRRRGMYG